MWTWINNKADALEHAAEDDVTHVLGSFNNAVAEGEREATIFVDRTFNLRHTQSSSQSSSEQKLSGTFIDAEQPIVKLEQTAKSNIIKAADSVKGVEKDVEDSIAKVVEDAGKGT
jgi:hypothetical protein